MIILLYGTDAYRRALRTRFWIEEYKKKHGLSPALRLDMAEEGALSALREFLAGVSMFDAFKLAVLGSVFDSSEAEAAAKFLKAQAARNEAVIIISEEKKPPAAFKFLLETKWREELSSPAGPALRRFVREEAARRGIALLPPAAELLARASRGDTWWIATELDRAALLSKKSIGTADLSHLGLETNDVEGLLYEFGSFSRGARLAALEKLLRGRHDPAMVFNRLAYRDPRRVAAFADCDAQVKRGKLDYEEALLALAIS